MKKRPEGFDSDHSYVQSPCDFLVKNYTEILHVIHSLDGSSFNVR